MILPMLYVPVSLVVLLERAMSAKTCTDPYPPHKARLLMGEAAVSTSLAKPK